MKAILAFVLLLSLPLLAQDNVPTDAGLYYQNGSTFTRVKNVCNDGMKIRNFGLKDRFVYKNPSALLQISDRHPVFVLVGQDQGPYVRTQFELVQMNANKKDREVEFAVGGVIKNRVETKIEQKGTGITVKPIDDLPPGEYLLGMHQGVGDATVAALVGCGYDFSVR
jgi:hypothetical protein